MVKYTNAVESLYDGTCTVIERRKVKRENKSTGMEEVTVHQNVPCRVSFKNSMVTVTNENLAESANQSITLFISPTKEIKTGCKVIATQNNVTTEYQASGTPKVYETHQEIELKLFKEWV